MNMAKKDKSTYAHLSYIPFLLIWYTEHFLHKRCFRRPSSGLFYLNDCWSFSLLFSLIFLSLLTNIMLTKIRTAIKIAKNKYQDQKVHTSLKLATTQLTIIIVTKLKIMMIIQYSQILLILCFVFIIVRLYKHNIFVCLTCFQKFSN